MAFVGSAQNSRTAPWTCEEAGWVDARPGLRYIYTSLLASSLHRAATAALRNPMNLTQKIKYSRLLRLAFSFVLPLVGGCWGEGEPEWGFLPARPQNPAPTVLSPAPDPSGLQAARELCRARASDFDLRRSDQLKIMAQGAPSADLGRQCLYVEMVASMPEVQRAAAAVAMARFAKEAYFPINPFSGDVGKTVPSWLSECPAQLGADSWPSVWRLSTVDFEVHGGFFDMEAPYSLLPALCADTTQSSHARASGQRGMLSAFVPRLAEANASGQSTVRWSLLEMLARLWVHADGPARGRVAEALSDVGEGLWPALTAWRDALEQGGAPPPASLSRALGVRVCGFEADSCVRRLVDALATTGERAAPRRPAVAGAFLPSGSPETGPSVWDTEVRGDAGTAASGEGSQSVMGKEQAAEESAARLLAQFGLSAADLDRRTSEAIAGVTAVIEDIAAGRRSSAALRAAHAGRSEAFQLQILRMVVSKLEEWSRYPSYVNRDLLGHRGLSLAWLAIHRFGQEPDAGSSADPALDKELMIDSLLRGLTEAVESGVGGVGNFRPVCPRGTGTRAIRSLQGYYSAVSVDTYVVEPVGLLGTLGEAFTRASADPTRAQIDTFLRESRQTAQRMYARYPDWAQLFERLLRDYESSLR